MEVPVSPAVCCRFRQNARTPGPRLPSEIGKRIGHRIRELRTQRPERWTQEDLAERARISVSFLSMIERGERVAHVETLASLAESLGVTLSELFSGADAAQAVE